MPIKPERRDGKGEFPEPSEQQNVLDDTVVDSTIQKATSRIVLFDILHMLIVGFMKTISGFLGIDDKSSVNK